MVFLNQSLFNWYFIFAQVPYTSDRLSESPTTFDCTRLVAYNLFSTLKGVLASVHGSDCREKLSYYYLGEELDATYQGMMIALPPEDWPDLATMSLPQFSSLLQDWAQFVKLEAFTSAPRKPKKKKPKPPYDPRHPHVSTARLLAQNKKSRASPNK